jgi:hypothetical protein
MTNKRVKVNIQKPEQYTRNAFMIFQNVSGIVERVHETEDKCLVKFDTPLGKLHKCGGLPITHFWFPTNDLTITETLL